VVIYAPKNRSAKREDPWQTRTKRKNVRTRFVPVRRNRAANTVAPHARVQARRLNSIVIAAMKSVPEISNCEMQELAKERRIFAPLFLWGSQRFSLILDDSVSRFAWELFRAWACANVAMVSAS